MRDEHRCVVSKVYNLIVVAEHADLGIPAPSDYVKGIPLRLVEMAHIIPFSLIKSIPETNIKALDILNMFHTSRFDFPGLDSIQNVISLRTELHSRFGRLDIGFERLGLSGNKYKTVDFDGFGDLPPTVEMTTPDQLRLPVADPRYLATHLAMCRILHLSAAGGDPEFINWYDDDDDDDVSDAGDSRQKLDLPSFDRWLDTLPPPPNPRTGDQ